MSNVDQVFLAITCADDTVAVMGFVTAERNSDGTSRWSRLATKENVDAVVAQSTESWDAHKLPVKGWRFIDPSDIPEDRTYRNALRDTGKVLRHDMPHAREIHRDRLRAARGPLLAALDIAYQRADEAGDAKDKKRIAAEKQALRDVTDHPGIEAAKTPDDLKVVWPIPVA